MANGNGQNSGGDRFGRIPTTQIIEKREETPQSAVKNPVAQARHLALGWAGLLLSIILALLSLGAFVFWLGAGVVGLVTFVWFVIQASRTEYVIEGRGSRVGVAPSEALAGFLLASLSGGVAWSFWMVLSFVSVDITLPDWLAGWFPQLSALGSLLGVVFSARYILAIEPAFIQELLYRSPAIEQGLGNLISQTEAPWHAGRIQKPSPLPNEVNLRVVYTDENDKDRGVGLHSLTTPFPYPDTQLRQIARIITTDGISESALCGSNGKPFPGGTGGRQALAELKQILQERSWGRERVEGAPTQGFILTKLGENVFHGLAGTTPPHREVAKTDAPAVLDERTNERTDVVSQDMDEWNGELPTPDGEW